MHTLSFRTRWRIRIVSTVFCLRCAYILSNHSGHAWPYVGKVLHNKIDVYVRLSSAKKLHRLIQTHTITQTRVRNPLSLCRESAPFCALHRLLKEKHTAQAHSKRIQSRRLVNENAVSVQIICSSVRPAQQLNTNSIPVNRIWNFRVCPKRKRCPCVQNLRLSVCVTQTIKQKCCPRAQNLRLSVCATQTIKQKRCPCVQNRHFCDWSCHVTSYYNAFENQFYFVSKGGFDTKHETLYQKGEVWIQKIFLYRKGGFRYTK